jgi:hypothetical protein
MLNVAKVVGLALVLAGCEGPQPVHTAAPIYQEVPVPSRKPAIPPVERRRLIIDGQLQDLDQRIKSLQETVTEHENRK